MKLTPITNPIDARLDTKPDRDDVKNDLGDMVGLLAGWTADMRGGRNLLLDSDVNVSSSGYLVTTINQVPGHGLKDGDPFVITLKGQLGADRTQFVIFNSDESTQVASMREDTNDDSGVYTATGTWKVSANNNHLRIYAYPSTGTSDSIVESVKLSRGTLGTPWSPSPEEVVADLKATGLDQLPNPLPPVETSLNLRINTSVGSRLYAGTTRIYSDTGWRDVRSWFTPHLNFDTNHMWAYVKRNGSTVTLEVQATIGENASPTFSGDIPTGFRPPMRYARSLGVANVGSDDTTTSVRNNSIISRLNLGTTPPQDTNIGFSIIWETRDSWPTTLPGLPA